MTLADQMDKENASHSRPAKVAGQTLLTCIKQAYRRHGLTCGLTPCAQLLKSNPSNLLLCVMPESYGTVSTHIHQTLIEAFCREKSIPVLRIQDPSKLAQHLLKLDQVKQRGGRSQGMNGKPEDVSCILIEISKRGRSKQDEALVKYCNTANGDASHMHTLAIPD